MSRSFSAIFGVCRFFPTVSVEILPCIGLLRETILLLLSFSVVLILKWFLISPHSVFSVFVNFVAQ